MKINENYEITVSERNVVLSKYIEPVEKFKKVDGVKESQGMSRGSWELQGYYPSHAAALRAYVNIELRSVPAEVEVLLRKIDEVMEVVAGLEDSAYMEIARLQGELRDAKNTEVEL